MLSPLIVTTMDGGNAKRLSGTIIVIHAGKKKPVQSTGYKDERVLLNGIWQSQPYSFNFTKNQHIHFNKPRIDRIYNRYSINHANKYYAQITRGVKAIKLMINNEYFNR